MQFGAACDFSRPLLPLLGTSASIKKVWARQQAHGSIESGTAFIPPSESQVARNQVIGFKGARRGDPIKLSLTFAARGGVRDSAAAPAQRHSPSDREWRAGLSTSSFNVGHSSAEAGLTSPIHCGVRPNGGQRARPCGCDATIPPGFAAWGPGLLYGSDIEDETTGNGQPLAEMTPRRGQGSARRGDNFSNKYPQSGRNLYA